MSPAAPSAASVRTLVPFSSTIVSQTESVLAAARWNVMSAPYGGLWPTSDGGSNSEAKLSVVVGGRSANVYAGRGSNRCARSPSTAGVSCRKGAMSSRIQKPRPQVATTRSSKSSCTVSHAIGVCGKLFWSGSQVAPSSNVTYREFSVPR